MLNPGAIVSTKRAECMYIVTEYGVATMIGKSVRERTKELIAIAHPDFRADLKREAEKMQAHNNHPPRIPAKDVR